MIKWTRILMQHFCCRRKVEAVQCFLLALAASDSSLVSLALSVLKKDTNILESTSGAVMLTDIASRVGILIGTRVNRKCTLGG